MRMQQLLLLVQKNIYIFKETYLIVPKNYKKKRIDSVTNDCQSHSHHINLNMFNKFNLCLNIVISKKIKERKQKKWKNNKQILNNVYNDIDDKLI